VTVRETVFSILTTDEELQALGITEATVWSIEAADNPDRGKPFVVIAWSTVPRPQHTAARRRDLVVWAHDEGGDYSRIDAILERVRQLLVGTVHQGGITQVDWEGASGDLYDDGFRTITRNSGFRVIGADGRNTPG
jgi:hypothetical protein